MINRFVLILFFCVCIFYDSAYAIPSVYVTESTYKITGQTGKELLRQMNTLGPVDNGQQFNAKTEWVLNWNYSYRETYSSCYITKTSIQVRISYEFPEWVDYLNSDSILKHNWNATVQQLRIHEYGHGQHGLAAGIAVENAMALIPPMENCEILSHVVKAKVDQITQYYLKKDALYDGVTRHGTMQI